MRNIRVNVTRAKGRRKGNCISLSRPSPAAGWLRREKLQATMEVPTKDYVVRNCLTYAYDALRSRERLMGDSTESYYEKYFVQLSEALGPPGKRWELAVPNSEVESFYLGNMSVGEFRLQTQKR